MSVCVCVRAWVQGRLRAGRTLGIGCCQSAAPGPSHGQGLQVRRCLSSTPPPRAPPWPAQCPPHTHVLVVLRTNDAPQPTHPPVGPCSRHDRVLMVLCPRPLFPQPPSGKEALKSGLNIPGVAESYDEGGNLVSARYAKGLDAGSEL